MAKLFTIYVEGLADIKFIKDYFQHLFNEKLDTGVVGGIIETKGKDKLSKFENQLLQTTQKGGINLIIFDADTLKNKGGFGARMEEIKAVLKSIEDKAQTNINYDVFLLPDHKNNGALEDLLEQIINPANSQIFVCWEEYEKCLGGKVNRLSATDKYTIPAKKSKIYSYLEVLSGETNKEKDLIKDPNRDFSDKNHWDLNNTVLNPLMDFLKQTQ